MRIRPKSSRYPASIVTNALRICLLLDRDRMVSMLSRAWHCSERLNSKAMSKAVCSAVRITSLLLTEDSNVVNIGFNMRNTRGCNTKQFRNFFYNQTASDCEAIARSAALTLQPRYLRSARINGCPIGGFGYSSN